MLTTHALENEAIRCAVQYGGGQYVRQALAKALKAYRAEGSRHSASWLRDYVLYITGHLWKE